MKTPRLLLTLTAANFILMILLAVQNFAIAQAQGAPGVLRGRGLEIVDEQGRVRASLNVLPASSSADGAASSETVLLRLITERGRPTVKIAASEPASGLSFAGPTGTKDTYVILESRTNMSLLRLRNEDGREQVVRP
jgi:hypothetical protein